MRPTSRSPPISGSCFVSQQGTATVRVGSRSRSGSWGPSRRASGSAGAISGGAHRNSASTNRRRGLLDVSVLRSSRAVKCRGLPTSYSGEAWYDAVGRPRRKNRRHPRSSFLRNFVDFSLGVHQSPSGTGFGFASFPSRTTPELEAPTLMISIFLLRSLWDIVRKTSLSCLAHPSLPRAKEQPNPSV